jgi:hypothetical protein
MNFTITFSRLLTIVQQTFEFSSLRSVEIKSNKCSAPEGFEAILKSKKEKQRNNEG